MQDPATGRELALRSLKSPAVLPRRSIGPEDVLAAFLAGRNAHTHRAYDADLRDFARFVGHDEPRLAVASLVMSDRGAAHAVALAWRVHLEARGLAPATVSRKLAALRAVVKLAGQLGQVDWELSLSSPRAEGYRDTRGPGDEGYKRVRELARGEAEAGDPKRVRDYSALRLLHDLGLRRGELVGIDLADVETDAAGVPSRVWIKGKKRVHKEALALPTATARALGAWMAARGAGPGPLFVRLDRGAAGLSRLTGRAVALLANRLGERAGLPRRLSPHGFRHQAITEALDKTGGDVRKVQRFSRHADLKTLVVYDDRRRDGAGDVSRLLAEDE